MAGHCEGYRSDGCNDDTVDHVSPTGRGLRADLRTLLVMGHLAKLAVPLGPRKRTGVLTCE